ncbi:MAG: hypothetical protein V5A44_11995 [Haloarculaceae archaeon]
MATVYRGVKSRVAGVVYGLVLLGITGGLAFVVQENLFVGGGVVPTEPIEWVAVAVVALLALAGLFNVGKALLQDDYRIIVNYHRSDLSVQFGHKLLD